ncbi:putative leader peptide [Streptomyces aureocirculatus]|uniref:putative leader peptide n=1 Tax=Streptomyces aureocirculatus TaxID=67275 RepID=UPI00384B93C3
MPTAEPRPPLPPAQKVVLKVLKRRLGATDRPDDEHELTGLLLHGLLRTMTDTAVRLWRRVHMDLVRYAGCVCRPSL